MDIADQTGGKYFHATDAVKLTNSLETIETLTSTENKAKIYQKRYDYRLEIAILICFLVFLEYIQRRYIMKRYKLI